MEQKKTVVGIGELLWDVFPEGKQLGGAPCNFVYHASLAGCRAYTVSAVGTDEPGEALIASLSSLDIDDTFIQKNDYQTGYVSVELNKKGHPNYIIHENVAWDYIDWNNALTKLAGTADAVCFGSLAQRNATSRISIEKFLTATPEHCLKVFDINLRQNYYSLDIIKNSLMHANVLKLNEDELPVLSKMFGIDGDVEAQIMKLKAGFGLKYIALTLGDAGSYLYGPEETSFVKAPTVNVVDTVGAGDSFTAILIAGILNDIPLKEVHKKATEVSAFVCTCAGAMPVRDKDFWQF